jgi:hypothetical protein
MDSAIIDPSTGQGVDYTTIPVSFPLNQFVVGQEFRLKRHRWKIVDIRNRIGMILMPVDTIFTDKYWTQGELVPIKGYWYRVAVVGREGFVLSPKEEVK